MITSSWPRVGAWTLPPGEVLMTRPRWNAREQRRRQPHLEGRLDQDHRRLPHQIDRDDQQATHDEEEQHDVAHELTGRLAEELDDPRRLPAGAVGVRGHGLRLGRGLALRLGRHVDGAQGVTDLQAHEEEEDEIRSGPPTVNNGAASSECRRRAPPC